MTRRSSVVCGVDIGSTNTKVVGVDPRGVVVGRQIRTTVRDGLAVDAAALLTVIEDMIVELCADEFSVRAVCVAGVGEDGVLVDDALTPLTQALAWFDPRRAPIYDGLAPHLAASPDLCTGDDAARTFVGWRWAVTQPDAARARSWLALADFPSTVWTGTPFMSDTLAARTAAWHNGTRSWSHDRVLLTLGSPALLPDVRPAGEVVGVLRCPRLADVLDDDAVAVAGGHDHPVGGWGVHLMDPGSILDSMGTAEIVVAQSSSPSDVRSADVDIAPGIQGPGTTVFSVEELARNIEWACRDAEVAAHLRALMSGDAQPDDYLHDAAFVPGRRGGGEPRFVSAAPRAPLSRASAVLGALARFGRNAEDAVAQYLPGRPPVYAGGGWSRLPGFVAAKQMVTGRDLTVIHEPQVTAVGAALLAARAVDWTPSPSVALGHEAVSDAGCREGSARRRLGSTPRTVRRA